MIIAVGEREYTSTFFGGERKFFARRAFLFTNFGGCDNIINAERCFIHAEKTITYLSMRSVWI